MTQPSTRWLLQEPSPGGRPLLFAFPYGGSGASSLRRWPGRIGEAEVHAVQLPGRENRIKDLPCRDFAAFAEEAVRELGPYLDRPYAVIGHCMGALLAHAFTFRAQQSGAPMPNRLFVSASLVPQRGFYGLYHPWMSDRRIAQELRRVSTGLGDGELPDEVVALSVPVLRRDVRMCLDYAPPPQPVDVPVTAIGWSRDLDVGPADLAEWRQLAKSREVMLPGEPLAFLTAPRELRAVVEDDFEY
ncbi:Thioesterase [Catenulispora acidiphila DSM 44928]|uniref:Thioesterase n=1 Tax=Catenulispora acidiphila (strain DSM 44928 / JCM 14897 / NBRC 102108 / NRRL B-24433 / ID139908) TaxID=479433 RepID=C7Q912_CATAD|nr:alpha/beta fold hydrolase [Catenulispora acidiphila]ACU72332.1 Thioesterase [Catenulispora acidiphila DSM 44928]